MSSTLTKASAPSPAGTTISSFTGWRNVSLKSSMNHAGRMTVLVRESRAARSSSTARIATSAGACSMPYALR